MIFEFPNGTPTPDSVHLTSALAHDLERITAFATFERTAERRLRVVTMATSISDLSQMPGWCLEALKGDRSGQWSIRINDQWRICFEWDENDAHPVNIEIADYH